jgi:putative ABC transport system permease protein
MPGLFNDLKFGFKMLTKNPGFTLVAVIALALGIGANTALFSLVYGILLKPLPYANGNDLVVIDQRYTKAGPTNVSFSAKEVSDYRTQTQTLSQVEEYHGMSFILLNDKEPDNVNTGVVSAHFFDLLGVKPILGRTFVEDDDRVGAEPVLILSHRYWMTKHHGDPDIVGKRFRMNDRIHTVIGVLPPIPQYPSEDDLYMTTSACPFRSAASFIENRNARMMRVFGRMKPGVSLEQAQGDTAAIAARLAQEYPASYPEQRGYTAVVDQLKHRLTSDIRPMLLVLLITSGFVLLIACANVANLTMARMSHREREFSIRVALGATRLRLLRQLIIESTMLSILGGTLGLLLASAGLNALVTYAARFTSRAHEVQLSTPVLMFTLAVSVLTGILSALLPAISTRRNVTSNMNESSAASTVRLGLFSARSALVIAQVAVSFTLLIGAGLLLRSFVKLQQVDPGFRGDDHILTFNVPLNFSKYKGHTDVKSFFDRLVPKIEALPGVEAVAVTGGPPLTGRPGQTAITIEGRNMDQTARPLLDGNIATADTFRLLGVPLVAGRFFDQHDTEEMPKVVIVNQTFARHQFPTEDPVNKRISDDGGKTWMMIVGVVGDVKAYGLDREVIDMYYQPFAQAPGGVSVMVRASGDAMAVLEPARKAVYSIDPEQPIDRVASMAELRGNALAGSRLTASLLGMFAVVALSIALTGLSGVLSFFVSNRTREIGIRIALGATARDVERSILSHAFTMVGIGVAVGIVAALLGSRMLGSLLFHTPAFDFATYVGVAMLFMLVSFAASYLPARRATQVDPITALRAD